MVGVPTTRGTIAKGHSIRKIEDHWFGGLHCNHLLTPDVQNELSLFTSKSQDQRHQ